MPSKHFDPAPALIPQESDDSFSDEVDLVEVLNGFTVQQRRRIYALKHLYSQTVKLQREMHKELAAIDEKRRVETAAVQAKVIEIVSGKREVTEEEVAKLPPLIPSKDVAPLAKKTVKTVEPDDERRLQELKKAAASPSGGIPFFWLEAMRHHDSLSGFLTNADLEVLECLENITTTPIEEDPMKGLQIDFHFANPNRFLDASKPLSVKFFMDFDEESNDVMVTKVEGSEIPWKSPELNPGVTIKQKKYRNKKTKEMKVMEKEEPCPSFFHFFDITVEEDEELEEEEEEQAEINIEIGDALMNDIIPFAPYFYSGRSVDKVATIMLESFGLNDFGGEDDEEDEESGAEVEELESGEDQKADFKAMVAKNRAPASGNGGKEAPKECKQQ